MKIKSLFVLTVVFSFTLLVTGEYVFAQESSPGPKVPPYPHVPEPRDKTPPAPMPIPKLPPSPIWTASIDLPDKQVEEDEKLKESTPWDEDKYNKLNLNIASSQGGGDPNIFSLDGNDPCTNKMHADQLDSFHWKFDLFVTEIPLKMERTLCDNTKMMYIDFNQNFVLDNGYEALWHTDYTTYEILRIIDHNNEGNNGDGIIDANDAIWKDVRIMDSNYDTFTPAEFGIIGFNYKNEIQFSDDEYGTGRYSDCMYDGVLRLGECVPVSETHFRLVAWNPDGLILSDNLTKPTYGAMQTPLNDCSIYDARYMIAEKQLSLWNTEIAMDLYQEGLEYCESMEFTHRNPDKLLSHWVAGIASAHHRDGDLLQAKPYYEEALRMSPDRHFYLTDYALLLDQLGYDQTITLPLVEKALEINPNHQYAITVKHRITN